MKKNIHRVAPVILLILCGISCRKTLPKGEFMASTNIRNTDCIEIFLNKFSDGRDTEMKRLRAMLDENKIKSDRCATDKILARCIETQQVKRTDSYPNADSVTVVYDRQGLMMHGRDAVEPLRKACKDQPPELKKEFD